MLYFLFQRMGAGFGPSSAAIGYRADPAGQFLTGGGGRGNGELRCQLYVNTTGHLRRNIRCLDKCEYRREHKPNTEHLTPTFLSLLITFFVYNPLCIQAVLSAILTFLLMTSLVWNLCDRMAACWKQEDGLAAFVSIEWLMYHMNLWLFETFASLWNNDKSPSVSSYFLFAGLNDKYCLIQQRIRELKSQNGGELMSRSPFMRAALHVMPVHVNTYYFEFISISGTWHTLVLSTNGGRTD